MSHLFSMCFSLFFAHHRNLIAFSEEGSDPYVRMYLLPDKRRSGRRKTHVSKKTLNPVFDQTYVQKCSTFISCNYKDGKSRFLSLPEWMSC